VGGVCSFECAGERGVGEAVAGRGRLDVRGDLDEVVAINLGGGLGKGDRLCPERGCRERGKNHQDRGKGSWHVVPRSDLRRVVKTRYRLQILGFGLHRVSENRTDFLLQTHGGHAPTFFCDEMSNSDQIFPSCPFNTGYA
jgi:hypothetical protein